MNGRRAKWIAEKRPLSNDTPTYRGGHIPGAQNILWATAVAEDGRFKSADERESIYGDKGIDGKGETIAYRRSGERSAHIWFVLRYLLGTIV